MLSFVYQNETLISFEELDSTFVNQTDNLFYLAGKEHCGYAGNAGHWLIEIITILCSNFGDFE